MSYSAIVLAGGYGRRMGGVTKPLLAVAGESMLHRVLRAVSDADHIVVVGPDELSGHLPTGVRLTQERPAGTGPVAGIAAGLNALRRWEDQPEHAEGASAAGEGQPIGAPERWQAQPERRHGQQAPPELVREPRADQASATGADKSGTLSAAAEGGTTPAAPDKRATPPATTEGPTADAPNEGPTADAPDERPTVPAAAEGDAVPTAPAAAEAPEAAEGHTAPAPPEGRTAHVPAESRTAHAADRGGTALAAVDEVPAAPDGRRGPESGMRDEDLVVVVGGDLPFLTATALALLRQNTHDAAVYVDDGGRRQPMAMAWSVGALSGALASVPRSMNGLMNNATRITEVPWRGPGMPPWYDCDTPEELAEAERRLS